MTQMSRIMGKLNFCKNKGTDQQCSNCTADQHLCFGYWDNTIPLHLKPEILSLLLLAYFSQRPYRPVCVRPGRKSGSLISLIVAHIIIYVHVIHFIPRMSTTAKAATTIKAAKGMDEFWKKNRRLNRPLSPHLTIYK